MSLWGICKGFEEEIRLKSYNMETYYDCSDQWESRKLLKHFYVGVFVILKSSN